MIAEHGCDAPAVALAASDDVVLRAVGIAKHYGVTQALKGVDFEVRASKVTALFGENGAGKSTLMKIMSGVERPTAGHLELDGEIVEFGSINEAAARGIAIIHQELNLCPNLSVRDNLFLGRELRTPLGGVDYARETAVAKELLARLEEDIDPARPVSSLRLGQQQIVEIARALAGDARVMIMDEPTSALSATEVLVLFRVIRELKGNGVAIIYISHHLEEAIQIADDAVVFRDGALVATHSGEGLELPWVVAQMLGGAEIPDRDVSRLFTEVGVALSVRDVEVADTDGSGRLAVDGVSFDVCAGEIVCLFGLMGAGRTELLECLAGRLRAESGTISLNGEAVGSLSIRDRIARGIGLVPEDRQRDGIVQLQSVGVNLSLTTIAALHVPPLLNRADERDRVLAGISEMRVKTSGPEAPIVSLSGGNQQKVVIGKMVLAAPKVLLLDEPTRGIDVGAKAEIYRLLNAQADNGLAVLFATSEIGEALSAATRILVMRKGKVVTEVDPAQADRDSVMAAAGGAAGDLLEAVLA